MPDTDFITAGSCVEVRCPSCNRYLMTVNFPVLKMAGAVMPVIGISLETKCHHCGQRYCWPAVKPMLVGATP